MPSQKPRTVTTSKRVFVITEMERPTTGHSKKTNARIKSQSYRNSPAGRKTFEQKPSLKRGPSRLSKAS